MDIYIPDSIADKNDEKMLLVILIGIFESLKNNSMTIREAERCLFSPYIFNKLKLKKCNPRIVNIIERGCELENIKSLIPDHLMKAIEEMEEMTVKLMNECPRYDRERWIQIQN